ncbi:MAG: class I SAM-dependent methyltransferase, partial [Ilumatobacter sp.]|uniref:class I SAM-dependent methyltransferase n=1 Tax=Ilumatobacter sp. TaxID=1967498 RepID=UPI003C78E7CC
MRIHQLVKPRRSLRSIFDRHEGRLIHKVDHYFPIYERHLERFRGTKPTILEIGVAQGGSIEMWHEYFGRGTTTVGLDLEARSTELAGHRRHIVIGDQGDPSVLLDVAAKYGPFDMILDDGSHRAEHQLTLIDTLWDHLTDDGVLLVEDLHTDYWPEYGGGHLRADTFIERIKPLLDDINAYNSREDSFQPSHWT